MILWPTTNSLFPMDGAMINRETLVNLIKTELECSTKQIIELGWDPVQTNTLFIRI